MDASEITTLLARKAELEKLLAGFEIWLLVFGLLVVIGVSGESVYGIRTWWNNRKIRNIDHSIDQYRQSEIARINKQTEDERTARVQLEGLLARRTLSQDQKDLITVKLSNVKGLSADIFTFDGDEWTRFEAMSFARDLDSVLGSEKVGLDTRGYWGSHCALEQPLMGVGVISAPDATRQEQEAAGDILQVFKDAGIDLIYFPRAMPTCAYFSNLFPDPQKPHRGHWAKITIMVGSKPPVMLQRPTVREAIRPATPPQK